MIVRNVVINFAGLALPLAAAIFTIPVLLHGLGASSFGLLTLIWALIGYAGFLDFGLGRSMTREIALAKSSDRAVDIGPIFATTMALLLVVGVLCGLLLAALTPTIVEIMDTGAVTGAMLAMAVATPAIVLSSGFRGVLEAVGHFGVLNSVRLPLGLYTFVAPVVVLQIWGPDIALITWALTFGRIATTLLWGAAALRALPDRRSMLQMHWGLVPRLATSGGWMTVSNILGAFLGYLDRFIVGFVLGTQAVAFYATPHEVASRLWLIPNAATAVLFPTFSAEETSETGNRHFNRSLAAIFYLTLPAAAILAVYSHDILSAWLGSDFASRSAALLSIFSIGILINCVTQVAFTFLQGVGYSRFVALEIALLETPAFFLLLAVLVPLYGLEGAAAAWLSRMALNSIVLFWMCYVRLAVPLPRGGRPWIILAVAFPLAFAAMIAIILNDPLVKALAILLIVAASAIRLKSIAGTSGRQSPGMGH